MALTPLTGSSAYVTNAEVVERCDRRTLADWLSDLSARLTPGEVTSSTRLTALAKEASGIFEVAVTRGQRYTPADVAALVAAGGNGAEYVKGVVAGLTVWLAWERRPEKKAGEAMPARAEFALAQIEALSEGEAVLAFTESRNAGLPDADRETRADVEARGGLIVEASRLLGRRSAERQGW